MDCTGCTLCGNPKIKKTPGRNAGGGGFRGWGVLACRPLAACDALKGGIEQGKARVYCLPHATVCRVFRTRLACGGGVAGGGERVVIVRVHESHSVDLRLQHTPRTGGVL